MKESPKILCVSPNPALDRRIAVHQLQVGEVNRAAGAESAAGGKSAHVAFVAHTLGAQVRWLAFLGGPEGEDCCAGIKARGVTPVVVPIAGRTRTNLELIDTASGAVTEILEPGPTVTEAEKVRFLDEFRTELRNVRVAILSGSLPSGVGNSFYAELVSIAKTAGCQVLLDTSGEALSMALDAAPDLIKPNAQEVSTLLGRPILSVDDAIAAAKELRGRGLRTVIISLGALGAVAVSGQSVLHGTAPRVKPVSTVGSGDSFLAGWAVAESMGLPISECLRTAIACGTANCLADSPGVFPIELIQRFSPEVQISERNTPKG
jgi:1-phosphofructokinase family hexose kinase